MTLTAALARYDPRHGIEDDVAAMSAAQRNALEDDLVRSPWGPLLEVVAVTEEYTKRARTPIAEAAAAEAAARAGAEEEGAGSAAGAVAAAAGDLGAGAGGEAKEGAAPVLAERDGTGSPLPPSPGPSDCSELPEIVD